MQTIDALVALEKLLEGHPKAMPAWQVQAMFLGALASTNMRLGFHHLLSRVLGEEDPTFESLEEANAVLAALAGVWNGLVAESESEAGARFAPAPLPERPSGSELRDFAARRHDEVLWFVRGIDAGGDDPGEFGNDHRELFDALAEAMAFFEGYRELLERKPGEAEGEAAAGGARALTALTATVESIVNDLLAISKAVRARALEAFEELSRIGRTDDGVRAGARKLGRNDPCPCGSGKKWKRCCGLTPAPRH